MAIEEEGQTVGLLKIHLRNYSFEEHVGNLTRDGNEEFLRTEWEYENAGDSPVDIITPDAIYDGGLRTQGRYIAGPGVLRELPPERHLQLTWVFVIPVDAAHIALECVAGSGESATWSIR